MNADYIYIDMLRHIVKNGVCKPNRTGVDTIGVFGYQNRYDLSEGFPLLTTKKMFYKGIIHELLWFLSGSTNIKYLNDNGVHIWNEWADESGELGPVYGSQWRNFNGVDQIGKAVELLITDPTSRRNIVSAWNPAEIEYMALPPCHTMFHLLVIDGKLCCQLYQRSADVFLGVPFNIASYALLTNMIAHVVNIPVGDFIHTFGDLHLYVDHISQAHEQIKRTPYSMPTLKLNSRIWNINNFKFEDIEILNYKCHPKIEAKIAV